MLNSQNTKPGLLVMNTSWTCSHTLNGLWQKVNCGGRNNKKYSIFYFARKCLNRLSFSLTINISASFVCEQRVHHLFYIAAAMALLHHVGNHSPQNLIQSSSLFVQNYACLWKEAVQVSVGTYFLLEVHGLYILIQRKTEDVCLLVILWVLPYIKNNVNSCVPL